LIIFLVLKNNTKDGDVMKKSKRLSKIISEEYILSENYDNTFDIFDNFYNLKAIFTVVGIDKKKYTIIATIDSYRFLTINIFINNIAIQNTFLNGKFNNSNEFYLNRIESKDAHYNNFGFGSILMKIMFKVLNHYCEFNNYQLKRIFGTIGIDESNNIEDNFLFYSKFDNLVFNKKKNLKLKLSKERFNLVDRHLEYLIA
jgi:hypothetical protein